MQKNQGIRGHRHVRKWTQSRGLTLIELVCTLGVTASAVFATAGGMRELALSQRLQAVASEFETQVNLAKSTAVYRHQTLRLEIQQLDQGTCVVIHSGAKEECRCGAVGPAECSGGAEVLHLHRHDARSGVTFQSASVSLAFSGEHGTVTPTATVKLVDTSGRGLNQIVNVMGRTRTCSPQGKIAGYRSC